MPIAVSVVILGQGFAGDLFFLHGPFSQIDQLAAFTAERLELLLGRPGHGALADGAFDDKWFVG